MDNKYIPFGHPMFKQTADGGGTPYVHNVDGLSETIGPPYEILSKKRWSILRSSKKRVRMLYRQTYL